MTSDELEREVTDLAAKVQDVGKMSVACVAGDSTILRPLVLPSSPYYVRLYESGKYVAEYKDVSVELVIQALLGHLKLEAVVDHSQEGHPVVVRERE